LSAAGEFERHPWRSYAILSLAYALVTLCCRAQFMGDTVDYADAVFRFSRDHWEFGHLLWVPLGWLVRTLAGIDDRAGVVRIFLAVNWMAGLACVLLLRGFLGRAGVKPSLATFATLAFLCAQGFLNFTLTGSSYVPGLAFLMLAFFLALSQGGITASVGAGLALGASICFWFPYVLAVPAVVLAPLILHGVTPARCWFVV
jgi:hypothetical protein